MVPPENAKLTNSSIHIEGNEDDESDGKPNESDGQFVVGQGRSMFYHRRFLVVRILRLECHWIPPEA
jgi:hypothetical protein